MGTWLGVSASAAGLAAALGYPQIPELWRVPALVLSVGIVIGAIFARLIAAYRSENEARRRAELQSRQLREELAILREEKKLSTRIIEIEGFPINTLLQFIADRHTRPTNKARLSLYSIHVRLTGPSGQKNARVTYRIQGINPGAEDLRVFYLTVVGEGSPRFEDLHCVLYELKSDPRRCSPLHPFIRKGGSDSGRKDIILPFQVPGIRPNGAFDLELTYDWPATFSLPKDYWFLDNANVEQPAQNVRVAIEFDQPLHVSATAYKFEPNSFETSLLGEVSVAKSEHATTVLYDADNSGNESFYVLIVKAH